MAWEEEKVFDLVCLEKIGRKGREKKKHANAFRVMIKDCYTEKGAKLCVY